MEHPLFSSLGEMLSPASFSLFEERRVSDVVTAPFKTVDSLSGSRFLHVCTRGVPGDCVRHHYVVKRLSHASDWLMRATGDEHGRGVLAWQTGLLDRVPETIEHGVVACAIDGDGRALLMRDLAEHLVAPGDEPISLSQHEQFLNAMAAMHAAFWDQSALAGADAGFCSLWQHYHAFSPEIALREAGGPDQIPQMIADGWRLLPDLVDGQVCEIVSTLLVDPAPLCAALEQHVTTVVHGDWKLGNMGLRGASHATVILLDWDRVSAGPAGLDLAWYLAVNSARLPQSKEATVATYTRELQTRLGSRFDLASWQRQLDLTLLGGFIQLGWPKLLGAASASVEVREREAAELRWWSGRALEGARWL